MATTSTTTTTSTAITTGGKDYVERTVQLYQEAFRDDPLFTYFLLGLSDEERHRTLHAIMRPLMNASALNKGIFEEIDNWSAASVLILPGHHIDAPLTLIPAGMFGLLMKLGFSGSRRLLIEFSNATDAVKKRGMSPAEYKHHLYVFFVATREDCRGRGLASKLMVRAQEMANKLNVPVWLEATTPRSKRVYDKLGFQTVEELRMGKGKVDETGHLKAGGPGVPLWAMVWRPPTTGA